MTVLFGHRGASAHLPENTMASFQRALDDGADALESDVHLTRDGHVVLSHDGTGQRMANVDAAIAQCDLAEVQSWDVGWGFVDDDGQRPFVDDGHHIPTLDDVLDAFGSVPLNLDVKQATPSMVAPLLSCLRRHNAEHRVTLASFHMSVLKELRKAKYSGALALGVRELRMLLALPRSMLALQPGLGHRAQVPLSWGPVRFDSAWFVGKCHELGVLVDYWTINDADDAKRLVALGADGLFTDDPKLLKSSM